MTLYLDSSALVKRYIAEPGSTETRAIIAAARTGLIPFPALLP
ncbi:MAG: hypothetical protein ACH37Z_03235 [Anaerolineae bacterium]|nr:hypothetical protein [Anaerolineae bacterium]